MPHGHAETNRRQPPQRATLHRPHHARRQTPSSPTPSNPASTPKRKFSPFEDASQLEALTADYQTRFHPTTPEARALVDSLIHHEWLLRRLRRAEAAIYHCDCEICSKHYTGKPDAEIISSRIAWELKKFDHVQMRINQTERNYHRSLKALQELEALETPPEPAQPADSKPTSDKLALFPENAFLRDLRGSSASSVKKADPQTLEDPGATPEPLQPEPTSTNLASFPENAFLHDLRVSSVPSVKNGNPQTLEDPGATPQPVQPAPENTDFGNIEDPGAYQHPNPKVGLPSDAVPE